MIVTSALQVKHWLKPLYGRSNIVDLDRIESIISTYNNAFDTKGCHVCSSSGRVEILGNHTDHNGGRVLACTVNRDILAGFMPISDRVIIKSAGYKDISFSLNDITVKECNSAGMVKGVLIRLRQLGYSIGGFSACITSSVPSGAGMSSSACFQLLVGRIIAYLYNDNSIDPETLARVGQWAENNYFNKPCGLMDQATIAIGGVVAMQFGSKFSYSSVGDIEGYNLIVTNTGGSHANLTSHYASIPSDMFEVAGHLGVNMLGESDSDNFSNNYDRLVNSLGVDKVNRAKHFYEDSFRVDCALHAITSGQYGQLVKLIASSGHSSRYQLRNVSYEGGSQVLSDAIDYSDSLLGEYGATRVHGGGFAGTILAIVPHKLTANYTQSMGDKFGSDNVHQLSVRTVGSTVLD